MKVLVWTHKHGDEIYDATTPEKELSSWKECFNLMIEYGDFANIPVEKNQRKLFDKAKKGDANAAKIILKYRSDNDYEYEHFELKDVKG